MGRDGGLGKRFESYDRSAMMGGIGRRVGRVFVKRKREGKVGK